MVGGGAPAAETASYLSGLLIGAEVAGVAPLLAAPKTGPVALIGDPALCHWYAAALRQHDLASEIHDGNDAVLAGLTALYRQETRP